MRTRSKTTHSTPSPMRQRNIPVALGEVARVRYRTGVIDRDGSLRWFHPWRSNLILDVGLNQVATSGWPAMTTYAAVGTGTTATNRDSGVITFTRAGNVVTASAAFFEAADVGRLLKFDTGEEMYVSAFTSATEVTVNIAGALGASPGTVWYVNQTQLTTQTKRTNQYLQDSGDNGSSWNAVNGEITHKCTFVFSTEAAPITYREVGWSWGNVGTDLFGRDVLPGGGDALAAGQQYVIICELILRLSPVAITAVPNVATGWDTAGNAMVESVLMTISTTSIFGIVAGNGGRSTYGALEPPSTKRVIAASATWGQLAAPSTGNVGGPAGAVKNLTAAGYAAGSFFRDYSATFGIAEANGTVHGLIIASEQAQNIGFSVKFTTPQTKANTHTLAVTFRISWQRRLTNA